CLSVEEIILNTRRLAKFMLIENQSLKFALKRVVIKESFETPNVKDKISNKSYRELGIINLLCVIILSHTVCM
ncbi:MAG: hypothetical protein JRN67_06220, partial [Nitrososphaerota archaeon]|nr:hypothetical protein [Nitrososphaerota archaeon]